MREGSIPTKGSKGAAADDRARCEAPIEEFVAFARRLLEPRSKNRLKALGAGSVAEIFTKRLIAEGLGSSSQAVTCLKLIGALGQETAWAARLRQRDATGPLPVAECPPWTWTRRDSGRVAETAARARSYAARQFS